MTPASLEHEHFDAWRPTEAGCLALRMHEGAVCRVALLERPPSLRRPPVPEAEAALVRILAHLRDGADVRGLKLRLAGTPFQQRVWERLQRIPRGQTLTYGELASELGTAPRAIGGACRANQILLLVPCHRVVAHRGSGGFAGHGSGRWPRIKRWLLAQEGVEVA